MYVFLDKFFFMFHSSLIVFILFGWIWRRTRRANLIVILMTAFSWTILGIWYGFGFCPCTDWHWQVREKLGYYDMPSTYTKFLIDSLTGLDVSARFVDTLAVSLLILTFAASVFINVRDWKKRDKRIRESKLSR
ncbi:MAG: DUF2784 domain-containing protein [Candidatus Aminicenantes bacterium]|nr:MAG: DUF2784 domain-containing protein [Candidatus Aminicenantes bacterium]